MPYVYAKFHPTKPKMGPTKKTWCSMTSIQASGKDLPVKTSSLVSLSAAKNLPKSGSVVSLASQSSGDTSTSLTNRPSRGRLYQRKQCSSKNTSKKLTVKPSSSKLLTAKTGSLISLSSKKKSAKTVSLVSLSSIGKTGSLSSMNGRDD